MDSTNIALIGIGDSGIRVADKIGTQDLPGIRAYKINGRQDLDEFTNGSLDETDPVIIVADLGYDSSDALARIAAEEARKHNKVSVCILTTPYLREGDDAIKRALQTASEILPISDCSMLVNKEAPASDTGRISFQDLLTKLLSVEEIIAAGIENLIRLFSDSIHDEINTSGMISALKDSCTFAIGDGFGMDDGRVLQALEDALREPMMDRCDICTARNVVIKLMIPKDYPLTVDDREELSRFVAKLHPHAKITIHEAKSYEPYQSLDVIMLATGFDIRENQ